MLIDDRAHGRLWVMYCLAPPAVGKLRLYGHHFGLQPDSAQLSRAMALRDLPRVPTPRSAAAGSSRRCWLHHAAVCARRNSISFQACPSSRCARRSMRHKLRHAECSQIEAAGTAQQPGKRRPRRPIALRWNHFIKRAGKSHMDRVGKVFFVGSTSSSGCVWEISPSAWM